MKQITPQEIEKMNKALDPADLLGIAFNLKDQVKRILQISKDWNLPKFTPKNILLMGLGGSAIGGDFVRTLTEGEIRVPVLTCRNYDAPEFVNEDTLCLCASYSGNTEETLSAYMQCMGKGAKIVAISTGGKLKKLADRDGVTFCFIPSGFQPRAALGLSFSAQLVILMKMGLIRNYTDELRSAAEYIGRKSGQWKAWKDPKDNPPLDLALKLHGYIPVIYGYCGYMGTMAYRWKCQFNENAKMSAISQEFPELDHNEIVGWGGPEKFYHDRYVIMLRDEDDPPRIKARIELTGRIISKVTPVVEIYSEGRNRIEKLLYLVLFGDLLTIYSAYLYEKDPSEISAIHQMKAELAKIGIYK